MATSSDSNPFIKVNLYFDSLKTQFPDHSPCLLDSFKIILAKYQIDIREIFRLHHIDTSTVTSLSPETIQRIFISPCLINVLKHIENQNKALYKQVLLEFYSLILKIKLKEARKNLMDFSRNILPDRSQFLKYEKLKDLYLISLKEMIDSLKNEDSKIVHDIKDFQDFPIQNLVAKIKAEIKLLNPKYCLGLFMEGLSLKCDVLQWLKVKNAQLSIEQDDDEKLIRQVIDIIVSFEAILSECKVSKITTFNKMMKKFSIIIHQAQLISLWKTKKDKLKSQDILELEKLIEKNKLLGLSLFKEHNLKFFSEAELKRQYPFFLQHFEFFIQNSQHPGRILKYLDDLIGKQNLTLIEWNKSIQNKIDELSKSRKKLWWYRAKKFTKTVYSLSPIGIAANLLPWIVKPCRRKSPSENVTFCLSALGGCLAFGGYYFLMSSLSLSPLSQIYMIARMFIPGALTTKIVQYSSGPSPDLNYKRASIVEPTKDHSKKKPINPTWIFYRIILTIAAIEAYFSPSLAPELILSELAGILGGELTARMLLRCSPGASQEIPKALQKILQPEEEMHYNRFLLSYSGYQAGRSLAQNVLHKLHMLDQTVKFLENEQQLLFPVVKPAQSPFHPKMLFSYENRVKIEWQQSSDFTLYETHCDLALLKNFTAAAFNEVCTGDNIPKLT